MSAIGKLARPPSLTVYSNSDGSLWVRVDNRRQRLHGGQHWIDRATGSRMRGHTPLPAPSRGRPRGGRRQNRRQRDTPPVESDSGSDDEGTAADEYDEEELSLALALSLSDAAAAAAAASAAAAMHAHGGDARPATPPPASQQLLIPPPPPAQPLPPPPPPQATPSCSICMDDIVRGQPVRALACGHNYHAACVARWLRTNRSCPVCRRRV